MLNKKLFRTLFIIFIIFNFSFTSAQQLRLIVSNITFETSNSLTFDVYLQNTGTSNITYSNAAFVWNYDPIFLNGGTAQFSLVTDYSEFPSTAFPPSALITGSDIIRTSSNLPGSNGVILPGEGKRISRFRFQTTASSFNGNYFKISWKNSVTPYTRVYQWNSMTGLPEEVLNLGFNVQQPLLVENFEFSGLLTSNGWTAHSGAGTNSISTTAGLTYTDYPGSGVGNAALVGNAGGEDVNRGFDSVFTDGATVYYSFLVNVNEPATSKTGDYFIHIGDRSSPTVFTAFSARIFARVVSDQVNFGLSNSSTATYGTTNFSKNQTYLLVVKYTINAAGNDTTKFWVFSSGVPQSEDSAGSPELVNSATLGQNTIDAIALRQGSSTTSPSVIVDGIRIGRNWEDIVTIPSGPQLVVNPSTLSGFSYFVGAGPSTSQSYSLSGSDLNPPSGNITVTAPTNYEVSLDNSTFTNTLLVPYSGGTLSATTVYARLKAGLAGGLYNGEVVTNSGGGASDAIVTCNGFVVKPEPTNHVSNFSGLLGNPSYYYINLNWIDATSGITPDGYLIRASSVSFDSIPTPVDGAPITNSTFNQNVAQGIQTVTFGLNGGTTYYFKIFPYTNSGTLIDYKTDGTIPQFSIATNSLPPLPITENFNYTTGSFLTQNGWIPHSGIGVNPVTVVDTNLSYTGYQNSNIGKSVYLTNTGEDVNHAFQTTTSGNLFASFLVSIDSAQNAGDYFFHFGPENTTTVFLGKVWVKRDSVSGNLAFGIAKRNNSDAIYTSPIYSINTTYLIVVKYEFYDGGTTNDSVKLWINPILDGNEPLPDLIVGDAGTDATSLAMFALRQGSTSSSPKLFIDGIRVANTWIPLSSQTTFQLSVTISNGWNMVSVPGQHPVDQNVTTWWSGKDPAANVFKFQGSYQPVTTVQPGLGYWMKHLGANTYNTGDEWPSGGINLVAHDPLNAAAGWNLIGGYEFLAPTAALTTNPSGLISGFVYGYTPGSGYQVASNLVPGYGYWVKLTAAGQININPGPKANFKLSDFIADDFGKIIITDNAGKSYTLYVAQGKQANRTPLDFFELPPVPFTDMFDVRYTSGRFVEDFSSALKTIQMQGVEYPVRIRVEGIMIRITDETGKQINERLKSGEEITISNSQISKLNVMSDIIPDRYSLEQNYPNPFNPTTTIEFSLPEDVENVRLTIYNALGEKVAELINGKMEAGRYRYQWNASEVSTGLYIYELKTNKFSSVKKMMLLK